MLRDPGGLEQPAGHSNRRPEPRRQIASAGDPVERHPQRACGGEDDDPDGGGGSLAEPDGNAHHQAQRREGGEPGQSDIGFPAGCADRQRQLGGAEMPEIIVGEVARRAEFAEHRVDRRQAEPRHRIDNRDLGMIEDRIGELHGVAGKFGQDGDGRDQRKNGRRRERPGRDCRGGFGFAPGRAHRQRKGARQDAERAGAEHRGRGKSDPRSDPSVDRQQRGAVRRPADDRRGAAGEHARQQAPAQRGAEQGPERGREQGTEQGIDGRRHASPYPVFSSQTIPLRTRPPDRGCVSRWPL